MEIVQLNALHFVEAPLQAASCLLPFGLPERSCEIGRFRRPNSKRQKARTQGATLKGGILQGGDNVTGRAGKTCG